MSFQVPHVTDSGSIRIPDGEIRLDDEIHILLEAKIGRNPLTSDQISDYARHLAASPAKNKKLICITQIDSFLAAGKSASFKEVCALVEPKIVPVGTCVWVRWFNVLDVLKSALGLTPDRIAKDRRRIEKGKDVAYGSRIAALFLEEVETVMYDKKDIDMLPHGEVEDVVLAVQDPWFMDVALRHRVWFPNNRGGRAARYVAHYETADHGNQNPKQIAFIARNRRMWNRITIQEAAMVPELQEAFSDPVVAKHVAKWQSEDKHCVVLTDTPFRLSHPLVLGQKSYFARIMPGWYIPLSVLCNARSIDDLRPAV